MARRHLTLFDKDGNYVSFGEGGLALLLGEAGSWPQHVVPNPAWSISVFSSDCNYLTTRRRCKTLAIDLTVTSSWDRWTCRRMPGLVSVRVLLP
ncbi:hypothetical protein [Rhodopila globiformis]|uniref:hypothetical protein n=1 Tax=Rhodopila globiformis TaxID=1071 RepID=UPI0011AFE1B5|nr:hypothetical protein [Rhodopila globiformis]